MRRAAGLLALAVVLLAGRWAESSHRSLDSDQAMDRDTPIIPGCSKTAWSAQWEPRFINADHEVLVTYRCADHLVHFAAAQYVSQHDGKEAVSESNELAPAWLRSRSARQGRVKTNGLHANELEMQGVTLWSWYAVGSAAHATGFEAKADEAWHAVSLDPVPVAVFTLSAEGESEASELLEEMGDALWQWYVAQVASS